MLEPTKKQVVAKAAEFRGKPLLADRFLRKAAGGLTFYNTYPLTFPQLTDDPDNLGANLQQYITGFSEGAEQIVEAYDFLPQISRLEKAGMLYQMVAKFAEAKLHPSYIGDKRKQVSDAQITLITQVYADAFEIAADAAHEHHDRVRVFEPTDFGYRRIQAERPLAPSDPSAPRSLSLSKGPHPLVE